MTRLEDLTRLMDIELAKDPRDEAEIAKLQRKLDALPKDEQEAPAAPPVFEETATPTRRRR